MEFKPEETLKKLAKDVTDAAKPYIDKVEPVAQDLMTKAAPVVDDIKTKAAPVVDDIKTVATPVAKDIKTKAVPVAQDLLGKAEPVLNMVKEKATPVTDKATKAAKSVGNGISKRAAKAVCKEEVYVQYNTHEVRTIDIVDTAKDDYVKNGHKLSDIKEIQVYIKPADNAAYYVVNHSETGKIEF